MSRFRTDLELPSVWPPPHDAAGVFDAIRYCRRHDPVGHQIHTVMALLFFFTLPFATAPSGITFAGLAAIAILRIPHTRYCYTSILRMPIAWLVAAWIAFFAMSVLWSPDQATGLQELGAARTLLVPIAVWPIIERLPWLLGAALAGVAGQNVVQILQMVDLVDHGPGRAGGLIHPIQTGAWCLVALCLHISAILTTRGRLRWISLAGGILAGVGLVATGSRGPWLAGVATLPLLVALLAIRRPAARPVAAALGVMLILAGVAGLPIIKPRIDEMNSEIRRVIDAKDYWSSTGLRVGLADWALDIFSESPIVGAGAGGFRKRYKQLDAYTDAVARAEHASFVERVPGYEQALVDGADVTALAQYEQGRVEACKRSKYMHRGHAHSTYLQTLATQGLIGAAILVAMLLVLLRSAWIQGRDHPYAEAILFCVLAWMIGAQFDSYHLNGHLLGLLALLIAATLPHRPAPRYEWAADDDPTPTAATNPRSDDRSSTANSALPADAGQP